MTIINKSAAFAAFDKFANARVALIAALQAAGVSTVEEARPLAIEWACEKTKAGAKGWRKVESTGGVKLVSSHPKYETTKTVVRDLMLMLQGTSRRAKAAQSGGAGRGKADPVADLVAAYEALTAAQKRKFLAAVTAA